jgi:hypothetical protein
MACSWNFAALDTLSHYSSLGKFGISVKLGPSATSIPLPSFSSTRSRKKRMFGSRGFQTLEWNFTRRLEPPIKKKTKQSELASEYNKCDASEMLLLNSEPLPHTHRRCLLNTLLLTCKVPFDHEVSSSSLFPWSPALPVPFSYPTLGNKDWYVQTTSTLSWTQVCQSVGTTRRRLILGTLTAPPWPMPYVSRWSMPWGLRYRCFVYQLISGSTRKKETLKHNTDCSNGQLHGWMTASVALYSADSSSVTNTSES